MALRFWPADVILDDSKPLWVGALTTMNIRKYLQLIHLPRTVATVSPAPLLSALNGTFSFRKLERPDPLLLIEENTNWQP